MEVVEQRSRHRVVAERDVPKLHLAAAENEIRLLLDEYQDWLDRIPESLQESRGDLGDVRAGTLKRQDFLQSYPAPSLKKESRVARPGSGLLDPGAEGPGHE
jgi:hypothetical protein